MPKGKLEPISSDYSDKKQRNKKGRLRSIHISLAENGFTVRYEQDKSNGLETATETFVYDDADEMLADIGEDVRKHSIHKMMES